MEEFANLVLLLGASTKTNDKLEALQHYFTTAVDKDKVWMIAIFSGRRPKRIVNSTLLTNWCLEMIHIPGWLFEESYHTVGDLAETIALLLPEPTDISTAEKHGLAYYLESFIKLEKEEEIIKKQFVIDAWMQFNQTERFVFNKLITGGFRIGVSQKMMVNALAKTIHLSSSVIAHRISGNWRAATTTAFHWLRPTASQSKCCCARAAAPRPSGCATRRRPILPSRRPHACWPERQPQASRRPSPMR